MDIRFRNLFVFVVLSEYYLSENKLPVIFGLQIANNGRLLQFKAMLIFFVVIYIVLSFLMAVFGIEKQSEVIKVFIISMILTPLAGIIWVYLKRTNAHKIYQYQCSECNYLFPVKMKHCPICEEKGKKVKLVPYKPPIDLTPRIQKIRIA